MNEERLIRLEELVDSNSIRVLSLKNSNLTRHDMLEVSGYNLGFGSKFLCTYVNRNFGLKSANFSKSLYDIDKPIWSSLVNILSKKEDVIGFKEDNVCIVINGVVACISKANTLDDIMKIGDILKENTNVNVEYRFHQDLLRIECIIKSNLNGDSIILEYLLDRNWIHLYPAKFTDDFSFVSPFKIANNFVESGNISDYVDISDIVNSYVLGDDPTQNLLINEFNSIINSIDLSVDEVLKILHDCLGIKYDYDFYLHDFAVEAGIYNSDVINAIGEVMDNLKTKQEVALFSSSLKKSVTFTMSASKVFNLLSLLYDNKYISVYKFSLFIERILNNKSNYSLLNDGY